MDNVSNDADEEKMLWEICGSWWLCVSCEWMGGREAEEEEEEEREARGEEKGVTLTLTSLYDSMIRGRERSNPYLSL